MCDSNGPFLGLGVSYFQALRHAKHDRARLNRNLAFLASNGFNYIRILSMVSRDGLEIAPVTFTNRTGRRVEAWPDYWQQFRDLLDLAGRHGLRVEVTVFADAQHVMPERSTRLAHLDGLLAHIAGRESWLIPLEVANVAGIAFEAQRQRGQADRRAAEVMRERTQEGQDHQRNERRYMFHKGGACRVASHTCGDRDTNAPRKTQTCFLLLMRASSDTSVAVSAVESKTGTAHRQQDAVQQSLWIGWAAGDVNIHGDYGVHRAARGVIHAEDAAAAPTSPHRHH